MDVWEVVSCRLRVDGWEVWHTTRHDASGPTFLVHLRRPGISCEVSGPTLTEAYAASSGSTPGSRGLCPLLRRWPGG